MLKKSCLMMKGMKKVQQQSNTILPLPRPSKHYKTFLFFLVLVLITAACQKQQKKDFFYTYTQSDPSNLDPFYSTDVVSGKILAHLFNGLFKINKDGIFQKDLLEHYSFDGIIFKGKLKKNVLFHNGTRLSARDIAFSYNRIMNSQNPTSPRKWIFEKVKKINLINDYEFEITLKSPSSTFPYLLTMPNCFIISEEAYRKDGSIIGSGPFSLSEWKRDESLMLIKNNHYYDTKPHINGIIYKIIPEDLTARFEFLNGTIDYFELPYLANLDLKENKNKLITAGELSVHYIALNNLKQPFNDKLFRKAVNMAIDRNSILNNLLKNRFTLAAGAVPNKVGDYSAVRETIPYNPSEAKKIIKENGYSGKEIILLLKPDHQVSLICQTIQHYLNAAGLNIKIREVEWSALKTATMKGNFEMAYLTWHADYPEAENFLYPLFFSKNTGAGGNRSFYHNKDVDYLLTESQETIDKEKRFALYRRIERIIVDDAPWIFLWYGSKRIALSERVANFISYPVFSGMKGTDIELK